MELIDGPTPNGGAYAQIYYFDSNQKSCTRENATYGHILEFDKNRNRISEMHFLIKGKPLFINKPIKDEEIEIFNIDLN